jgi:hypothetical protein
MGSVVPQGTRIAQVVVVVGLANIFQDMAFQPLRSVNIRRTRNVKMSGDMVCVHLKEHVLLDIVMKDVVFLLFVIMRLFAVVRVVVSLQD